MNIEAVEKLMLETRDARQTEDVPLFFEASQSLQIIYNPCAVANKLFDRGLHLGRK